MMQQFFQNSFFDGLFNATLESPIVVQKTTSNENISTPFSLFGMKKHDSVRDITTASLLKTESKNSKERPYYPHSGMGLFFV